MAVKVSREQAAKNRTRIVETASALFRERGFDAVGVAEVMKAAGLTHGGFYGHFASKDDLLVEGLKAALAGSASEWTCPADDTRTPLRTILRRYLTLRHRDARCDGCTYAALAADVARRDDPSLRRALTQSLGPVLEGLAKAMPAGTAEGRRTQALATFAGMVGALILARSVDDADLSAEILAATQEVLGGLEAPPGPGPD